MQMASSIPFPVRWEAGQAERHLVRRCGEENDFRFCEIARLNDLILFA